jgi:hypothetical protein
VPEKPSEDRVIDALIQGFGVGERDARRMLALHRRETPGDDQVIDDPGTTASPVHVTVFVDGMKVASTTAGARMALPDPLPAFSVWSQETEPARTR